MMLAVYVSSLIRCVIALHKLIDNKEMRLEGKKSQERMKVAIAEKVAAKQNGETSDTADKKQ